MNLLKNDFVQVSECIYMSERLVMKVGDLLLINVYLPCLGTENRLLICNDILSEICSWRKQYPLYGCIIGGDFNTDLDSCSASNMINRFLTDNQFLRCLSTDSLPYTFVNESRNYFSKIDYMVYNNVIVNNFTVLES